MKWIIAACTLLACTPLAHAEFLPGTRVLLDAHNCYPYHGRWADRIERALSAGTPLAIEQDLVWYRDPVTGKGRSLVAHDEQDKPNLGLDGTEPSMRDYFFERVRPIVERALIEQHRDTWPLIILHLDVKTEEPEHLHAIRELLSEYKSWMTTARRTANMADVQPLVPGPLLVLTEESDAQRNVFYDEIPVGEPLFVFGAATPIDRAAGVPGVRTNYHRWWNNAWNVVESGGQQHAGDWTREDDTRLRTLVARAHDAGLWIRFYTLNGHDPSDTSGGWTPGYNFGSLDAARERWKAAIRAGVDFVAVDQYELFARTLSESANREPRAANRDVVLKGVLTREDYKRRFERTFIVPEAISQLRIELSYSGGDEKTVIDLGLRDMHGLRGWSGGGPQSVTVGRTRASFGYLPGSIEPGEWAVMLGVPNIRPGRNDAYTIDIKMSAAEDVAGPVLRRTAGWFAGDLHSHSGHSDGRTATAKGERIAVPEHRVFDAARSAGLDFIALSDHNTTSHWLDVDRLQPFYDPLLLLHAEEITTYHGHFNAVGAFSSINHPAREDAESCMGCHWDHLDVATMSRMNGVEVVNGDSTGGWKVWAELLNRGFHLTAVGGSDEHTPEETRDRRIGTPTTVVYAHELSEAGIVDGLKSGRVYVRLRGPAGPRLEFYGEAGGRRYEMGEVMPRSKKIALRVRVEGAAGQRLTWIRNGAPTVETDLPADGVASLESNLPDDATWFAVTLSDGQGPTVFSSAIYIAR